MKQDKDTDYKLNWIESYSLLVSDFLSEMMDNETIILKLKDLGVEDEMLSLILAAGHILYQDEENNYIGE